MKQKLKHLQSLVAVALCVIMAMTFTSCGDDDDAPDNNSIVGTWLLSQKDSYGYWYCQYTFSANGTFGVRDWSSDSEEIPTTDEAYGKYSINGDILTLKFNDDDETESYRFELKGNQLIIYDYEEPGPNIFVRK